MPQRQGTILKKCQCANQERCSHKWTLRYWADGRQRERSFGDELDGSGRPGTGPASGWPRMRSSRSPTTSAHGCSSTRSWEACGSGTSARSGSAGTWH